jgi:hypothetical protein
LGSPSLARLSRALHRRRSPAARRSGLDDCRTTSVG